MQTTLERLLLRSYRRFLENFHYQNLRSFNASCLPVYHFEHTELAAKLLDYFLLVRSIISNINQTGGGWRLEGEHFSRWHQRIVQQSGWRQRWISWLCGISVSHFCLGYRSVNYHTEISVPVTIHVKRCTQTKCWSWQPAWVCMYVCVILCNFMLKQHLCPDPSFTISLAGRGLANVSGVRVCLPLSVCVRVHVCMCMCLCVFARTSMWACKCVCVCVCVPVCIREITYFTDTHWHTRAHKIRFPAHKYAMHASIKLYIVEHDGDQYTYIYRTFLDVPDSSLAAKIWSWVMLLVFSLQNFLFPCCSVWISERVNMGRSRCGCVRASVSLLLF